MTQQSYVHIRLRRDTAQNWTSNNPILKIGEPGLETNTRKLKIGDGSSTWNQLQYISGSDNNPILVNTNEVIDDRIANLLVPGAGITMQYDDNANLLLIGTSGLQPSGNYATLINGTVPAAQLPSYVDDVLEYANLASFPTSGEGNKIYVAVDTKIIYRWSGSTYVEVSPTPAIYNAAVPWTANHTLADGTRYLINDIVYDGGQIYRAKFDNESLPTSNTTYWQDLGNGYRLNIDGRDIPNIPYPVTSVNGLTGAVTIDTANTGDITFSGVQIIGNGEDSGDGNGYGTIELVPDNNLYNSDQYLIVDPTLPGHIHLRAGGTQDNSNAELILGGEKAQVKVLDSSHEVKIQSGSGQTSGSFNFTAAGNGVAEVNNYGVVPPTGAKFVVGGIEYTIQSAVETTVNNFTWVDITFFPQDQPTNGTYNWTFGSPVVEWTFGNDGVLDLASGGIRFADNSVQVTASGGTGDITFNGVQIIGDGEGSGDGLDNGTIELVPDSTLYANDQYLIVDPTSPGHIHLRAGGDQDDSNAELILGGEIAHVRVLDSSHTVKVKTSTVQSEVTFTAEYGGSGGYLFILSGNPVPSAGSTFSVDGQVVTITSATPSSFDPGVDVHYTPGSVSLAAGSTHTAVLAASPKEWTFEDGGVLDLASGGLRFADNSVQTTAGMPLAGASWGDTGGYYAEGAVAFGLPATGNKTQLTMSWSSGSLGGNGQSSIVLTADQPASDPDATVVLSISGGNGMSNAGSLTLSAQNGITFRDATTQNTAGVVSIDPEAGAGGLGSFTKTNNIVKLSQADFDTLAPDANTLYLIVG